MLSGRSDGRAMQGFSRRPAACLKVRLVPVPSLCPQRPHHLSYSTHRAAKPCAAHHACTPSALSALPETPT
eukprot:scaffold9223_cov118-Isochrysis_galbana.AAC.4